MPRKRNSEGKSARGASGLCGSPSSKAVMLAAGAALVIAGCGSSSNHTQAKSKSSVSTATTAQSQPSAQLSGTCTIGFLDSMSGPLGVVGAAELKGANFAISQIDDAGGINGAKLALTTLDDQGTVGGATVAFQRFATQDHVPLVVGPGIAGPAQAVAPLASRYKLPNLNMTSSVVKGNPYVFNEDPAETVSADAMVKYALSKGYRSAYLISAANPYGEPGAAGVKAAAAKVGISIIGTDTYDPTAVSFAPQATKAASAKPSVVFIYGSGSSVDGLVLKALRGAGYTGPVVGDLSFALATIPKVAGNTANLVALSPVNYAATSGPTANFLKAYTAANKALPSVTATYGYEVIEMAAHALSHASACSTSGFTSSLNNFSYQGVLGLHTFTASQHEGPTQDAVFTPIAFSGTSYVPAP